jgi:hypothetical protein
MLHLRVRETFVAERARNPNGERRHPSPVARESREGSIVATIITTYMPRNEAAAPGHV